MANNDQSLMKRLRVRRPGVSFDQNTVFSHGSEFYFIDANITIAEEKATFPVDGNNIVEFIWENRINSLYITGSITIRDSTGRLGIINNSLFTHVTVFFSKVTPVIQNGKTVDYIFDGTDQFTHSFFVNNVTLADREKNEVDYTLDLVSDMYFATNRMLYWSNYDKITASGSRPDEYFNPFKILKELFKMAYTDMDKKFNLVCQAPGYFADGFDNAANKCKLLIDYSTNTKTTIVEAIDYLINKSFYTKDANSDKSLRMLAYDEFNKKFKLLDFKDAKSFVASNYPGMWICLAGTPLEELTVPIKQSYSSLNLISNMEFFNTFLRYTWISWSDTMQSFIGGNRKDFMSTVTTEDIAKYTEPGPNIIPDASQFRMGSSTEERKVFDKIFNTEIPGYTYEVDYNKIDTSWNSNYAVYLDLIYNTVYKDALSFNTNGKIRHNPGTLINIVTDMDAKRKLDSDLQAAENHPHGGITDVFFVVETVHIVHPNEGSAEKFTENLVMTKWWERTD